jgi:hypothetical protein
LRVHAATPKAPAQPDARHGEAIIPASGSGACDRGTNVSSNEAVARGCAIGGCENPDNDRWAIGDGRVIVVGPVSGSQGVVASACHQWKIFRIVLVEFIDSRIADGQHSLARPARGSLTVSRSAF